MNILLAPSIPTDGIKLQSLSKVITLNAITCKPTGMWSTASWNDIMYKSVEYYKQNYTIYMSMVYC